MKFAVKIFLNQLSLQKLFEILHDFSVQITEVLSNNLAVGIVLFQNLK